MKKLFLIFLFLPLISIGQDYTDFLPEIAWRTIVDSVVYQNVDTFTVKVNPFDLNDPGAFNKVIGNFLIDNKNRKYKIIDSTNVSNYKIITVVDVFKSGAAPYQGLVGYVIKTPTDLFPSGLGTYYGEKLDPTTEDYGNAIDLKLAYEHGQEIPFDYMQLFPRDTIPEFKAYTMWYNAIKHAVSTYTENPNVSLDNGEELWTPLVINENGTDIPDGYPVYSTGEMGILMTVEKANSKTYEESRVIGLATLPIAVGDTGRITRFGDVNLDLTGSGLSLGDIYLDETQPLGLSNTIPDNGEWICYIGRVIATGVNGRIFVNPYWTERTAEQNDETGWPETVASTFSFDGGTRTFTLSPTGTDYYWYEDGVKYTSTGQSSVIPDENGQYLFYEDEGTLTYIKDPSLFQVEPLIRTKPLVAWVNYDADNNISIFTEDERHKRANFYSRLLHVLIHFAPNLGTQYLFGLGITDLVVDGTGNLNSNAQLGIEAGGITDEDLSKIIGTYTAPATIPVYYRSGANGYWRTESQTGYAQLNALAGRMQYNQWTGTTWQKTEMTNGAYAPILIYATGGENNKIAAVMSQNEYVAIDDAYIAALSGEGSLNDIGQFPFIESRLIGVILAQTRSNYANAVKTRFISIPIGGVDADYYDTRLTSGGRGGSSGTGSTIIASDVSYNSTLSGIPATNVQDAIDYLGLEVSDINDSIPALRSDIDLKQNTSDYESTQLDWIQSGKDANSIKLSLFGSYSFGTVPLFKYTEIPIVNSTYDGLMSSEQLDSMRNNSDSIPALRTDINQNTTDIATLDASAVKTVNSIAPTLGNVNIGLSNLTNYTTTSPVTVSNLSVTGGGFGVGKIYYGAVNGTTITGKTGSTYDLSFYTPVGTLVAGLITGTQDFMFGNDLYVQNDIHATNDIYLDYRLIGGNALQMEANNNIFINMNTADGSGRFISFRSGSSGTEVAKITQSGSATFADEVTMTTGATVADAPTALIDIVRLQELSDTAAQLRSEIPTVLSELTNDVGYWTADSLPSNLAYNNINNNFSTRQTISTTDTVLELSNNTTNGVQLKFINSQDEFGWIKFNVNEFFNISNATTAPSLSVDDDPYGVGWNGSTLVPTKNAVYDAIEAISSGAADGYISNLSLSNNTLTSTGVLNGFNGTVSSNVANISYTNTFTGDQTIDAGSLILTTPSYDPADGFWINNPSGTDVGFTTYGTSGGSFMYGTYGGTLNEALRFSSSGEIIMPNIDNASQTYQLYYNLASGEVTYDAASGGGTVTSVGVSSSDFSVSGSPITTSGTITLNLDNDAISNQTALTSGLVSTDEMLVSDAGVLKRMDVSVLQTYMQDNLAMDIISADVNDAFNDLLIDDYVKVVGTTATYTKLLFPVVANVPTGKLYVIANQKNGTIDFRNSTDTADISYNALDGTVKTSISANSSITLVYQSGSFYQIQ